MFPETILKAIGLIRKYLNVTKVRHPEIDKAAKRTMAAIKNLLDRALTDNREDLLISIDNTKEAISNFLKALEKYD